MQLVPALVAVAAAAMIATPEAPRPVDTAQKASVQFTNSTTGTASVNGNNAPLFADVAAGQTTDWGTVSDSTVRFTMVTSVAPSDTASVTQAIEEGARYTLVGTVSADGKPSLSITMASQEPAPAPAGTRR
jgi:hypothetical protein